MSIFSTQGSITIKRLRNGDSIFLTLDLNGKPLYQTVDKQNGSVVPSWTVEANRPVITPHASSTRNNSVILSSHKWLYNGVEIEFNGSTSGDYVLDSTGTFGKNPTTGALKIFKNLASLTNFASDSLQYSCTATVSGIEYQMSKSIDVQIVVGGASSYYGFIKASTTQLDDTNATATLATELWLAATSEGTYYVKWYKDSDEWTEKAGQKTITITREDVSGAQLFVAEFYKSQSDPNYIYRAAVSIIDTADEIILAPYISSANKTVNDNMPVTVAARLINATTKATLNPTNPAWKFTIMDGDTWTVLGSTTNSSIEVNTSHTDQDDGSSHDVVVIVECSFDSIS